MATQCEGHAAGNFARVLEIDLRSHRRSQSLSKRRPKETPSQNSLHGSYLGIQGGRVAGMTHTRRLPQDTKVPVSWNNTQNAFWTDWQQRQFRVLGEIQRKQQTPFSPLRPSRRLGYSHKKRVYISPLRQSLLRAEDFLKPHKTFLSLDGRRSEHPRSRSPESFLYLQ